MSLMSFFLTVYYAMLVAYSILYFVLSFRSKLDWATCGSWAGPSMIEHPSNRTDRCAHFVDCTDDFSSFVMRCNYENTYRDPDGRCYTWTSQGKTPIGWWNIESRIQFRKPVLPSDDYFKYVKRLSSIARTDSLRLVCSNYILNKSPGMGFISTMEWPLVLSLLGAWIIIYACLCRGVKLSGKVRRVRVCQ